MLNIPILWHKICYLHQCSDCPAKLLKHTCAECFGEYDKLDEHELNRFLTLLFKYGSRDDLRIAEKYGFLCGIEME